MEQTNTDLDYLEQQAKKAREDLLDIDNKKTKIEEELMLLTESLTGTNFC